MKSNQKGFSVLEVVILIVLLSLFIVTGWLVYSHQNNNIKGGENNPQPVAQKVIPSVKTSPPTPPPDDMTTYSDEFFSLKYPKDWKIKIEHAPGDTDAHYRLQLHSVDFETGLMAVPESGSAFTIDTWPSYGETFESLKESAKEAETFYGGNYSEITRADDLEVVARNHHSHGGHITGQGIRNGRLYKFTFSKREYTAQESIESFKKFIASVDIK